MRRAAWVWGGILFAGCSNLPTSGDGVVALEVLSTPPLTLTEGDSLTLRARALDKNGDSVATQIIWRTSDTTLVTLDSLRGVLTARTSTGSVQVQAAVGTLRSDPLTVTFQPASPEGARRHQP